MGNQERGRRGEELSAQYLRQKGYAILERNYRAASCEVDIIALYGEMVVFAEVKARTGTACGMGREAVGPSKQARIVRAAQAYLQKKDWFERPCRFDVLEVDLLSGIVEHMEGAFFT